VRWRGNRYAGPVLRRHVGRQLAPDVDEMHETRIDPGDVIGPPADGGEELREPEIRDRGCAAECEHV
jgi:hypothetical protein